MEIGCNVIKNLVKNGSISLVIIISNKKRSLNQFKNLIIAALVADYLRNVRFFVMLSKNSNILMNISTSMTLITKNSLDTSKQ